MKDYTLSKEKITELEKLHHTLHDKRQAEHLKASKGKNDPIYFADATHPQRNSIPSYGWSKKGQEKELKANCGRQRLNINGAINIETLEPATGFYDTTNADSSMSLKHIIG